MHFHLPFSKNQSIHIRFGIAVLLNAVLATAQILYAHSSHSVSLLSDAVHNLGDVCGLFIAWCAQILARSTRYNARYTYGYKKATLLAAFLNALLLLSSVSIILYETVIKLVEGGAMDGLQVVFIAGLGIIINGCTALLFIREKSEDINIKAAFLHLSLDALTSLGVVISALIVHYGGYQWIDSLMAFIIAGTISINGWKLLRRSIDLLLGAVPEHIQLSEVVAYLKNIPGVMHVQNMHVWALGTEENALTAHLEMAPLHANINTNNIEQHLKETFKITKVTLQTHEFIEVKE